MEERLEIIEYYNSPAGEAIRGQADLEKKQIEQVFNHLKTLLKPKAKILDLGCGNALYIHRLLHGLSGEYWGVDLSQKQLEYAIHKNPASSFLLADFLDFQHLPQNCDLIVLKQVLQEIPENKYNLLLEQTLNSLKDEGLLIISYNEKKRKEDQPFFNNPNLPDLIEITKSTNLKVEFLRFSSEENAWAVILKKTT